MSQTSSGFVTIAKVGDVVEGGVKVVRLDEQDIALFLIEGKYYAIDDVCTHDGGPLAEGPLEGCIVECPRHGAKFDVTTGAVVAMPATTPVPTYDVIVEGDEIKISWA
jgi:3-phenylpropionate/trans-cinnamate dioxygenase ferredoxin subunit